MESKMSDFEVDQESEGLRQSSMLEILETKLRSENQKTPLHRIYIVSKLHNDFTDLHNLPEYYENKTKAIKSQLNCDPLYGLLIIYPRHLLHILECSTIAMVAWLKEMREQTTSPVVLSGANVGGAAVSQGGMLTPMPGTSLAPSAEPSALQSKQPTANQLPSPKNQIQQLPTPGGPSPILSSSRVLAISRNVPKRLFSTWCSKTLDVEPKRPELFEPGNSLTELVSETTSNLLHLAHHFSKQPNTKTALKNTLDTLTERVPEFIPPEDQVGFLAVSEDKIVMSLEELLKYYEEPVEIRFSSDLVWPMPIRLFPYN